MFFSTCTIMKTTSLFVPLLTAAFVSAHGYINYVTINGKPYNGNAPGTTDTPSIVRQRSINPILGAQNTDLACGTDSKPASLAADVNPGDVLRIFWKGGGGPETDVRFHL